jgi:hypothetical protein
VAVLAAVFTNRGGYASPAAFVDGFKPALVIGAGLTGAGIVAALLAPARRQPAEAAPAAQPLTLAAERR